MPEKKIIPVYSPSTSMAKLIGLLNIPSVSRSTKTKLGERAHKVPKKLDNSSRFGCDPV
jgi:hypothetical protein